MLQCWYTVKPVKNKERKGYHNFLGFVLLFCCEFLMTNYITVYANF